MSRVKTLIKIALILLVAFSLVNQVNYKREVKKKSQAYISKDFITRDHIFYTKFVVPAEEFKKKEQLAQKQKEIKDRSLSRGNGPHRETFILTFYTSLDDENGFGPITCNGRKLSPGMVANNVLPQGTRIITRELGELVVADRGGPNFNVRHRLDVFIPRESGESDAKYKKRVNNIELPKIEGYIIN